MNTSPGSWSAQWASNHAVGAKINDMWMKPADWTMAFAVGDGGTLFKYNHFAPRNYDPLILPEKDVNDIHGVSTDKMFAAGDDGVALAYNSTHAMWQEISAISGLTTKDLLAVHSLNGYTHFVGENGILIGYDGTSAVTYSPSYTGNLNDVCANSLKDAYAVGTGGGGCSGTTAPPGARLRAWQPHPSTAWPAWGRGYIYVVGDTGRFTRYTNNTPTHFLSVTTQHLNVGVGRVGLGRGGGGGQRDHRVAGRRRTAHRVLAGVRQPHRRVGHFHEQYFRHRGKRDRDPLGRRLLADRRPGDGQEPGRAHG